MHEGECTESRSVTPIGFLAAPSEAQLLGLPDSMSARWGSPPMLPCSPTPQCWLHWAEWAVPGLLSSCAQRLMVVLPSPLVTEQHMSWGWRSQCHNKHSLKSYAALLPSTGSTGLSGSAWPAELLRAG